METKQTQADFDYLLAQQNDKGGKFAVEVIADDSGHFCGNAVRFDRLEVAIEDAKSLAGRWIMVREWRIVLDTDAK